MVTRLTKHDDRFVLVLDASLVRGMQIDETTDLEVTANGDAFVVQALHSPERRRAFEAALSEANAKYPLTLQRLAE